MTLITFFTSLINLLPDSFIQSFVFDNFSGFQIVSHILKTVNYFVPVYHLANIMRLWLPIMSAVVLFYVIKGAFNK